MRIPLFKLPCSTLKIDETQPIIFDKLIVLSISKKQANSILTISIFLSYSELNVGRLYPLCSKFFLILSITGFIAFCNIVVINDSSNGDLNSTEIVILVSL